MDYTAKEPSIIVYNGIDCPNLNDGWLMSVKDIEKNYNVIVDSTVF